MVRYTLASTPATARWWSDHAGTAHRQGAPGRPWAWSGNEARLAPERAAPDRLGRHPYSPQGVEKDGRIIAVFFTSDSHFGHGGALGLFSRPFATVEEMDAVMIERWNARVGSDDQVWHLGDVAMRPKAGRIDQLLGQLAGEKHLIIGNLDGAATVRATGWASVGHYAELAVDEAALTLCHYPLRSWHRQAKGAWNLHGHSHGRLCPLARQMDVGVDVFDFRPVRFEEIRTLRASRRRAAARRDGR